MQHRNSENTSDDSSDKQKYYKKFIKYREKYMNLLAELNRMKKLLTEQKMNTYDVQTFTTDYSGLLPQGTTMDASIGSSCGLFLYTVPEINDTYTVGMAGIQREYYNHTIGNYKRMIIKTVENNRHITPAEIKQLFDADWWFTHETTNTTPNYAMINVAKSILSHYRMCGYIVV